MCVISRLFAETGSEESLNLVATCYYRAGNLKQAYHILKVSSVSVCDKTLKKFFLSSIRSR